MIEQAQWKEKEQDHWGYLPTKARLPPEAGSNGMAFTACKHGCGGFFFFCELEVVHRPQRGPELAFWHQGNYHVLDDGYCLRAPLASVLQL